jgi:hypothetical protein
MLTQCENPKKPSAPKISSQPASLDTSLSAAELLQRFQRLFTAPLVAQWLQGSPQVLYERAFTPLIVLWYLLLQRLQPRHTLSAILSDALQGGADSLSPPEKPLSQQLRSAATTSYSDARQRLPLQVLQKALVQSGREIRSWAHPVVWRGFQVVLLDGSTVRLRPCGDIPKKFGIHRSRSKHSYWCLMRVVVGFCFSTGVLVGTVTGATSLSEQALAAQLLASLPPHCLMVGDRNFGVFSVLQAATAAPVQVLVRLTRTRAGRLARIHQAKLHNGLDLLLDWAPTRHDKTDPNIPRRAVAGRLIALRVQRRGFRSQMLYLFTTLRDPKAYSALDLLDLYGARWQAELNLRSVKTQLQLHALECKSAAMAEKEWLAGLLAYNLIRSLMVAAAARFKRSVHILSFSRTLDLLRSWITLQSPCASRDATAWERLLGLAAQCQHPRRKTTRPPEPRAKRYFNEIFPPLKGDRAAARQKLKTANSKS